MYLKFHFKKSDFALIARMFWISKERFKEVHSNHCVQTVLNVLKILSTTLKRNIYYVKSIYYRRDMKSSTVKCCKFHFNNRAIL